MKKRELTNLGVPRGAAMDACVAILSEHRPKRESAREAIATVLANPESGTEDPVWGPLASALLASPPVMALRSEPVPMRAWGRIGEDIDPESAKQARNACELPIAAAGALMPDAHVGYGLPIGGVLATRGAVIPYAVGVDIACRMKLTVFDAPPELLESDAGRGRLGDAIEKETRFGMGASFGGKGNRDARPREHAVLDEDWTISPITARAKDKARVQLGTSGSGNHFVEFGTLHLDERDEDLGLDPGTYLALMSHSGSRGPGAAVCGHYSKLSMEAHPELEGPHRHLAWLDLDSEAGSEYWAAMNLMGRFASANHACIHDAVGRALGFRALSTVENHHNFAWKETHDVGEGPEELIVHRKGATPAGSGVLGVIPGSMADPAFIVRGKGGEGSLDSASHGAGRVMSRSKARNSFRWNDVRDELAKRGVTVLSAGIDENPFVYKDIRRVMSQQHDLVEPIARFEPRLVKMAPEGEKAED
ncbi:MAG: RtcB family protein [Phycisphaerales bacterium JB040]